jgi:predicted ATPase
MGESQERGIVGETPNLAARLQAMAEPGSIVIGPQTHLLLGKLFEYRDLGSHAIKGFTKPVHVRQVLGASKLDDRFEAMHQSGTSPLLGREEELDLLMRRWEQIKHGDGRVVLLIGEPGIGKSRLARTLGERVRSEPHNPLIYHCSPYHKDSALHPVISQLLRAASIERADDTGTKLNKLETLLAQSSEDLVEDMPLFAALLSVPGGDRYPVPGFTPQRLKELTLATLLRQLNKLAIQQPVMMVFEDLHWIDPTSLELLSLIVDQVSSKRILLLATARPEFTPPWPSHRHISTVLLSRLGRSEVKALVSGVTKGKSLPSEVLDQIATRTDGIPLFIEELTKTVLESGLLRERKDDYVIDGSFPALSIPMTLHASLMARLDRLAPVREVVQIAAALGTQFSHELLLAVAGMPERQLCDAMEQLIRAELIFRRGTPPDADYTFKHTLVRDVAYATLLRANRQRLHARIAHTYETRFPEVPRVQPELLARHLTEAGLTDAAVDYWQRAGELTMARSGNAEAVHHFYAALDLVALLGDKPDRAARELELCVKLGPALIMVKGASSPEVHAIYTRALALRNGEDSPERFKVLWGLYLYSLTSGQLNEAAAYADELLVLAQRLGASDLLLEAYHARWASLWLGDLSVADASCRQGIALYDRSRHHALAFEFSGHDPGVCAHGSRAINMSLAGFPHKAMKSGAEAVRLARSLAHPYSLALAMWKSTIVLQFGRQRQRCHDLATNLVELSQEHQFPIMLGNGRAWMPVILIKGSL